MKPKSFLVPILLLAISFVFCLSSCERENMDTANPYLVIVKFKKPEYKNYICARYNEGDSVMTLNLMDRAQLCPDAVGKSGCSPYWELPEEWLLVDWKWAQYLVYIHDVVLLTGQTWNTIEYPITTPQLTWPASISYISRPIADRKYIDIIKLEEYGATTIFENESGREIPWAENPCPCEYVEYVQNWDKIWSLVQGLLSQAIENGDLNKL